MKTHPFKNLLKSLQHTIQIATNSRLVVAVSGGADSIALLHALAQLRASTGLYIHAATLNHGLRETAAEDVRFVQAFAKSLDVPVTAGQGNIPKLAQVWRMNIEAAARRARYHFLAGVASQVNADTIVTAHHADDQAETILMHFLRGSGLKGLAGMAVVAPVPDYPKLRLLRPFLNISRAEIEAYCQEHGLTWRHDETNDDILLLRNRIRLETLPLLAEINPGISAALRRLADVVQVEQDYMQQQFEQFVLPHITVQRQVICMPLDFFARLHPAMQRRLILYACEKWYLSVEASYERVLAAVHIAQTGQAGKLVEISERLQLYVDYYHVLIGTLEGLSGWYRHHFRLLDTVMDAIHLRVPEEIWPDEDWSLRATAEPHPGYQARLAIPKEAELILRTRGPGDRFQPSGMHGQSQKLKEWLINHKIPQPVRDHLPLLVVNGVIAAIILKDRWVIAEPFAVTQNPEHSLYLSATDGIKKPE